MTDVNGTVLRRDTVFTNGSTNAPHEIHFLFDGVQVGDVSNNGTSDVDYVTSIANHTATPGSGYYTNGACPYRKPHPCGILA